MARAILGAAAILLGLSLTGLYLKSIPPTRQETALADATRLRLAQLLPGIDSVLPDDTSPHAYTFLTRPGTEHLVFVGVYGVRNPDRMRDIELAARQTLDQVAGLEAISLAFYAQPIRELSPGGQVAHPRDAFIRRVLVEKS